MGGRFCSLDQLYKKFSENDVLPSPKLNEDHKQEKVFAGNWSHFSPKSGEDQKKRFSPQFAIIFGKELVGSFSPGWLFFLWSSSAQLSVAGRLNLDEGTLTLDGTRPPYNLSTVNMNISTDFSQNWRTKSKRCLPKQLAWKKMPTQTKFGNKKLNSYNFISEISHSKLILIYSTLCLPEP